MILNGLIMSSRLPSMIKTQRELTNCCPIALMRGKPDMSMVRIQKLILWVTMTNIMNMIPSWICGL